MLTYLCLPVIKHKDSFSKNPFDINLLGITTNNKHRGKPDLCHTIHQEGGGHEPRGGWAYVYTHSARNMENTKVLTRKPLSS